MRRFPVKAVCACLLLVSACGEEGSTPPPVRTAPNGVLKDINEKVWGKSRAEVEAALGAPYGKRRERDGMVYWFYDLVVEDDDPESRGVLKALHFIWQKDGSWRGIGFAPPDKWYERMMNEARFPPELTPD